VDFVHGYKSDQVRQNLFFNPQGFPVYMTAALGVILDPAERRQVIFGGGEETTSQRKQAQKLGGNGHSDDIMALTVSADRKSVATG